MTKYQKELINFVFFAVSYIYISLFYVMDVFDLQKNFQKRVYAQNLCQTLCFFSKMCNMKTIYILDYLRSLKKPVI